MEVYGAVEQLKQEGAGNNGNNFLPLATKGLLCTMYQNHVVIWPSAYKDSHTMVSTSSAHGCAL